MKNPRIAGIFYARYKLGLSAPNPDTKDFSRKVLWNLKSFAKIKCVFRWEVLWLTFLSRKVSWKFFGTPFFQERCVLLPTFLIRKVGQGRTIEPPAGIFIISLSFAAHTSVAVGFSKILPSADSRIALVAFT